MLKSEKQRRKMQAQSEAVNRLRQKNGWPTRYDDGPQGQMDAQRDAQIAANELGFPVCEMFSWYYAIPTPNNHWICSKLFAVEHVHFCSRSSHIGFTAWPKCNECEHGKDGFVVGYVSIPCRQCCRTQEDCR